MYAPLTSLGWYKHVLREGGHRRLFVSGRLFIFWAFRVPGRLFEGSYSKVGAYSNKYGKQVF